MSKRSMLAAVLGSTAAFAMMAAGGQETASQPAPPAAAPYEPPIVLTHEEPHHRQVFQYGQTRILDLRIPPNDITWFHTHEWPVLYVSFSNSQVRMETLGQDNQAARAGGAPAPRGGAGPRPGGAAANAAGGNQPAGPRATSTTSYVERPVTHRLANIGTNLVRAMVVVNETAGDETVSEQAARFEGTPELTNKWFRSYRRTLQPGESSASHNHGAPVAIIQVTAGTGLAEGPMKFELNEIGQWAFFDTGAAHTLHNTGDTALELLEIEVRQPR